MQKGWKANWLNYFRGRTRPRSLFKRGRGKKRKESRNACSIIISPRGEPPWHSWQTTCLWSGLHDFDDRDIWHSSRFWHSSPTLVPTTTDSPFAIFPLATNGDDRLHFVYMSMDGHLYTYIYIYIFVFHRFTRIELFGKKKGIEKYDFCYEFCYSLFLRAKR